jgi:predicted RNase H-like nuclease (RuvC/YqgF family)
MSYSVEDGYQAMQTMANLIASGDAINAEIEAFEDYIVRETENISESQRVIEQYQAEKSRLEARRDELREEYRQARDIYQIANVGHTY